MQKTIVSHSSVSLCVECSFLLDHLLLCVLVQTHVGLSSEYTFDTLVTKVVNTPPSTPLCPTVDPVTSFGGNIGNFVSWSIGECTDAEDSSIIPVCDPPSGRLFSVGSTLVTCSCTDSSGLSSECTFNAVVTGG
ncbi:hypothetical protein HOLleu_12477 [Holothuria leucospilota]|uniref:HYR domain-containing protein n=1 Tax=Holothuria leucospilota TaxID=206669 RepID=A0A9Q1HCZ8_HOLLE|nr:hypothetical protein HOLleu_12477 [Holothuria leucospilota]